MALRGSRNYERRKQCPNETNWSGRELMRQEGSGKGAGREGAGREASSAKLAFPSRPQAGICKSVFIL